MAWWLIKHMDNFTISYGTLSVFLFNPSLPEVHVKNAYLDSVLISQKKAQ
jgi:hypothetical protein